MYNHVLKYTPKYHQTTTKTTSSAILSFELSGQSGTTAQASGTAARVSGIAVT
jgi:hypothetical protein